MSKATVHFITGGQRSGKSAYAERLALQLSDCPVYLATSKHWDSEHTERIKKHQNSRSKSWITLEEEMAIHTHDFKDKVVLLDCVTLWLTNIYDQLEYDVVNTLNSAQKIWEVLLTQRVTLIVVSNEIGLGVIPMESATRKFVDLQGEMNQYIAKTAHKVDFMVSGLPLKIK